MPVTQADEDMDNGPRGQSPAATGNTSAKKTASTPPTNRWQKGKIDTQFLALGGDVCTFLLSHAHAVWPCSARLTYKTNNTFILLQMHR